MDYWQDIHCEVCGIVVGQWNYGRPNGALVSVRCREHIPYSRDKNVREMKPTILPTSAESPA